MKFILTILKYQQLTKKTSEQEIEESQNIQINEEENDNFLGESFAIQEQEKTDNDNLQKKMVFYQEFLIFLITSQLMTFLILD